MRLFAKPSRLKSYLRSWYKWAQDVASGRPYEPAYQTYPSSALAQRRFYNFGSGDWRHPYWTNVDYASDYYNYDKHLIDLPWDISLLQPIGVESNSAHAVFCSHTAEHLTDEQDRFMFREAARILKPGGVFRVTCPNVEQYYTAYRSGDVFVNYHYGHSYPFGAEGRNTFSRDRMVIWFVNEIATQLVQPVHADHKPIFAEKVDELNAIFDSVPMEQACDKLCGLIDYKLQQIVPGHHINWWTYDKMKLELKAAGFSQVVSSVAGGSVAAVMRHRLFFDRVSPTFSLFVDAIK